MPPEIDWSTVKHFKPEDFRCHGLNPDGSIHDCGLNEIDPLMVLAVDELREEVGVPITITSATRCDQHDRDVGGAPGSPHRVGPDNLSHAIDFACESEQLRFYFVRHILEAGFNRVELTNLHIHFDNAGFYRPHPFLAVKWLGGKP